MSNDATGIGFGMTRDETVAEIANILYEAWRAASERRQKQLDVSKASDVSLPTLVRDS